MNTNNDSFKCYLEDNQEVFKAWGRFVADEISNQVAKKIYPVPLATFFKLDPTPEAARDKYPHIGAINQS